MRIIFFIVCFFVVFVSDAFSNSLLQPHSQSKLPQVSAVEILQHDWTGFYSGLVLGPQFGHSSDKTADFGYNADNDKWSYNTSGFNAGAEFGYSYSLHGFVIGPEVELGHLGVKGNAPQPVSPGLDTVGKSSSDFYTAFRGRIGVNVKHTLIFATGGIIEVDYTTQVVDVCGIAPCGGSTVRANNNNFVRGYIVGGGVERFVKNGWSLKLEYLYFKLDEQNFYGTTNLGNTYNWTGQSSGNIIRGGLNYHF